MHEIVFAMLNAAQPQLQVVIYVHLRSFRVHIVIFRLKVFKRNSIFDRKLSICTFSIGPTDWPFGWDVSKRRARAHAVAAAICACAQIISIGFDTDMVRGARSGALKQKKRSDVLMHMKCTRIVWLPARTRAPHTPQHLVYRKAWAQNRGGKITFMAVAV